MDVGLRFSLRYQLCWICHMRYSKRRDRIEDMEGTPYSVVGIDGDCEHGKWHSKLANGWRLKHRHHGEVSETNNQNVSKPESCWTRHERLT